MSRSRNIKVQFTGVGHISSSLFQVGADGGVPTTSSVTFDQLVNSGPGFDMTLAEESTFVFVSASDGACAGDLYTSSFNSYPFPSTSPIRLSSTNRNTPFDTQLKGVTYVPACDDIYASTSDQVYRIHNKTGEVYSNKGPFDFNTGSIPTGPLVYLPNYDAIAYADLRTAGSGLISNINVVSMSGDMLYQVDFNESIFPRDPFSSLQYDGDRYLYSDSNCFESGTIGLPVASVCRIDLYSMSLDIDWTNTYGTELDPVSGFLLLSGSTTDIVYWHREKVVRVSSGSTYTLELWDNYPLYDGITYSAVQLPDSSIVIAGNFRTARYAAPGSGFTSLFSQRGLIRVDEYLDFRPFSSSFSRYPTGFLWTQRGAYKGLTLVPDYDYIIVNDSAIVDTVFNVNEISGSVAITSGSLAYIDYTGSMIPFNYPTASPNFAGTQEVKLQPDNSYVVRMNVGYGSYAGQDNGSLLVISQSGVLTSYL